MVPTNSYDSRSGLIIWDFANRLRHQGISVRNVLPNYLYIVIDFVAAVIIM